MSNSEKDKVYLTKQGLVDLNQELNHLIKVERHEVAKAIQAAKEYGDLSENAEYENAKNQQAFIEGRISRLQKMLANAVIIEDGKKGGKGAVVTLGSTVTIKNSKGKEQTFTIVGSVESDPFIGRISNASPMGQALLGHPVGVTVKVPTPGGINEVTIMKIA